MSSVRSALLQPLYRGIARWNRLKQHDDDGNHIFAINPESEHVSHYDEKFRIIDEAVAERVDQRLADVKARRLGERIARPQSAAQYLLSVHARKLEKEAAAGTGCPSPAASSASPT